ncbi:MAG TPA: hypothetical protein VK419_13245 [Bryobacteraceae bacterium]|nr:hypothetical protein [Bryobacteraceae bacterium]
MADELSNGKSRLDRVEALIEVLVNEHIAFAHEHKQLLTAQIVLTDRVDRLARQIEESHRELREAQKHTDDRLNALISIVDDLIRKRPPQ